MARGCGLPRTEDARAAAAADANNKVLLAIKGAQTCKLQGCIGYCKTIWLQDSRLETKAGANKRKHTHTVTVYSTTASAPLLLNANLASLTLSDLDSFTFFQPFRFSDIL